MFKRLVHYWVYGTLPAGILLLLLAPLICHGWSPAIVATYLVLPIYMIHQYEEHENDRFLRFINSRVGRGKVILTLLDSFVINVPIVWGICLLSLYCAVFISPSYGLIAFYLILVNAIVHIAGGFKFRGYNPGLGTAVALFLPLSIFGIRAMEQTGNGRAHFHLLGAGVAILLHLGLLVLAKLRGL